MPISYNRPTDWDLPSYRQLRIIEAIAEHRSIGKAADALHLSQPAVTRALQAVENRLGVKLFDRTPNGVTPTIFLEPVLTRAQSIHAAMLATENELKQFNLRDERALSIGGGPYSIEIFGYPAAARMKIADQNLKLSIMPTSLSDLVVQLRSAAIDIAISELGLMRHHDDLQIEPVRNLPVVFVCRPDHPLNRLANPTLKDVTSYPLAGNVISPLIVEQLGSDMGHLGHIDQKSGALIPSISVMIPSAIKHVVAESDAVALMPEMSFKDDVTAGRLKALPHAIAPRLAAHMGIVTHKDMPATPLMNRFRHEVHEIAKSLPTI